MHKKKDFVRNDESFSSKPRTRDYDNIKMMLKWTVTDQKMTFNNHFDTILIS